MIIVAVGILMRGIFTIEEARREIEHRKAHIREISEDIQKSKRRNRMYEHTGTYEAQMEEGLESARVIEELKRLFPRA